LTLVSARMLAPSGRCRQAGIAGLPAAPARGIVGAGIREGG
jgi:hypothetical protein